MKKKKTFITNRKRKMGKNNGKVAASIKRNRRKAPIAGRLELVEISKIAPSRVSPRTVDSQIPEDKGLLDSINATGGPVVPPAIRLRKKGKFETVFGHRRIDACRKLGFENLQALVYSEDVSNRQIRLEQVVENEDRLPPNPFERADAYHALVDEFGSEAKAAKARGMTRQAINDVLKVLEIKPSIRKSIEEHQTDEQRHGRKGLSASHHLEIAKGKTRAAQKHMVECAEGGMTTKQMREERGNLEAGDNGDKPKNPKTPKGGNGKDEEPAKHKIALADHDEIFQHGIPSFSEGTLAKCSNVARGIAREMRKERPFGAKPYRIKLDWEGDVNPEGDVVLEYEGGKFFVALKGSKRETYGKVLAISACLPWNLYQRYVDKPYRVKK